MTLMFLKHLSIWCIGRSCLCTFPGCIQFQHLFGQALVWSGAPYCPMLPIVACLISFFQIYFKNLEARHLTRLPNKPLGISKQNRSVIVCSGSWDWDRCMFGTAFFVRCYWSRFLFLSSRSPILWREVVKSQTVVHIREPLLMLRLHSTWRRCPVSTLLSFPLPIAISFQAGLLRSYHILAMWSCSGLSSSFFVWACLSPFVVWIWSVFLLSCVTLWFYWTVSGGTVAFAGSSENGTARKSCDHPNSQYQVRWKRDRRTRVVQLIHNWR